MSRLDALHSSVGELVIARLQAVDLQRDAVGLRDGVASLQGGWRELASTLRSLRSQLAPADWRDLERRLGNFGRDLRDAERAGFKLARRSVRQTGQLGAVSEALEGGIQQVRLQPLGPFFESFGLAVRDAARSRDVSVRLACEARGLEADRAVVEGLRGPLLHLLRNAVAHGIERASVRRQEGKPERGTVRLEATMQGDHVEVSVLDDGRGIDRDAVRSRAGQLGLLGEDDALDDERLLQLLCVPGFSTSAAADGVAGRGVGMDVVADAVHGLRGTLRASSRRGEGAGFHLRVPISVTTTHGLIVEVGPYRFGVPLDAVRRVVMTKRSMLSMLEGSAVLYFDGDPLTTTSLADLVGALEHAPADDDRASPALVLAVGGASLVVIVDDVPGELPMVIRPLGAQFGPVPWLAGAAIEADGSVLPVLEPRGLVERARTRRRTVARAPEPAVESVLPPSLARRVLVVDDSITMRTLQRNILEGAGYDVIVAGDGLEARDVLRTEGSVDLVVTDIDMPRMDGLDLCRWIRSSSMADLPVVMVTSLDAEEQRRQGLEAGADGYIAKGNFRQGHFLATVRRLAG